MLSWLLIKTLSTLGFYDAKFLGTLNSLPFLGWIVFLPSPPIIDVSFFSDLYYLSILLSLYIFKELFMSFN